MQSGFLDKVIERLDKIDSESLQSHFLRLAQEKGLMETIFQSIQEGIIVLDSEARVSYANKAIESLIGVELKQLQNRHIGHYLRDIDWDKILDFDTSEWSRIISHEIEINYPERKFLSFYVVPVEADSDGNDNSVLIMIRDITQDRQQEASAIESERLDAVRLLAAGVAHEIGNPLNALNIHLQLIDRELKQVESKQCEPISELVDVAKKEVQRLDLIITQFLRAIRPVKPKLALAKLEHVLKDTLSLLKHEIENRSIHVEIESHSNVPRIKIDKQQMKQAFFNVIKNAFQAMPDGGSLQISISASDRFALIAFRDTGEGISSERFGRIFEPYETTKPDGTGLGLMIVQRIVQDHGGAIEVHSEPEVGTTVTVLLPLIDRQMRMLRSRSVPVEDNS